MAQMFRAYKCIFYLIACYLFVVFLKEEENHHGTFRSGRSNSYNLFIPIVTRLMNVL